jgi:hypothetical protein
VLVIIIRSVFTFCLTLRSAPILTVPAAQIMSRSAQAAQQQCHGSSKPSQLG